MQLPLFHPDWSTFHAYGGIGFDIGHEIGHAFDTDDIHLVNSDNRMIFLITLHEPRMEIIPSV